MMFLVRLLVRFCCCSVMILLISVFLVGEGLVRVVLVVSVRVRVRFSL